MERFMIFNIIKNQFFMRKSLLLFFTKDFRLRRERNNRKGCGKLLFVSFVLCLCLLLWKAIEYSTQNFRVQTIISCHLSNWITSHLSPFMIIFPFLFLSYFFGLLLSVPLNVIKMKIMVLKHASQNWFFFSFLFWLTKSCVRWKITLIVCIFAYIFIRIKYVRFCKHVEITL